MKSGHTHDQQEAYNESNYSTQCGAVQLNYLMLLQGCHVHLLMPIICVWVLLKLMWKCYLNKKTKKSMASAT